MIRSEEVHDRVDDLFTDDSLERASEGLIPRLGGGDATHEVLAVTHIEIEVGEELLLGQGVSRVDAEVRRRPGRAHPRRTAHLDAPPNAQAIGQAGLVCGGHVEITLALELRPESLPQRGAGHQGYLDVPSTHQPGLTYRLRVGRRIEV